MGIGAVAGVPVTGVTIREAIIQNIIATLEAVRAGTTVTSDDDNVSQEVSVASSGAYTGLVLRNYEITVVVGGVSGVAQITIVDTTVMDDGGPIGEAVTTGVPVAMGALGLSVTFTFAGTLVAGDVWNIEASIYQSDVSAIYRGENKPANSTSNVVYGILRKPTETSEDTPIGHLTKTLELNISFYALRVANPETVLDTLLGDCEKALMSDHTRGGLAIDTTLTINTMFARDQIAAHGGFDLEFEILYRHLRADPYTQ